MTTPARIPISAVLITLDAEKHLDQVLGALALCDEILVLDSGSKDRTREIALAHGARFEHRDFDGYGPQKRTAVALARHDWILSVDADEILDESCLSAIAAIDWDRADPHMAFRILRRPFVGSKEIRHGHWVPDRVVRLFNRRHNGFSADIVHESVHPTGPVRKLPGSMRHYSYSSPAELFRSDYSLLKAQKCREERPSLPGAFRLALRADWAFFHSLIIRRGILDGPIGVLIAISAALNSTLALALAGWDDPDKAEPGQEPEA